MPSKHNEIGDVDDDRVEDVGELDDAEDLEVLDSEEAEDAEGDEEQEEDATTTLVDQDESDQASLEELLAQRGTGKRGMDDSDDESDIMGFAREPAGPATERLPLKVAPVRDRQEFGCKSCHLVKPRVQLANADRWLCRDCA